MGAGQGAPAFGAPEPPPGPMGPGPGPGQFGAPPAYFGPPPTSGVAGSARFGGLLPTQMSKPLIVTLSSGLAVVLVVALIWVIAAVSGGSGSSGGGSAGDAVQGYLQALARGDAAAALAFGQDQPASTALLSNDILKKQIDQWPITNIRILSDDSTTQSYPGVGMAQVHVTANFGPHTSDATIFVQKNNDGEWKLPTASIKIAGSQSGLAVVGGAAKTATLFGEPVPPEGTYVFPGYLDIGSTSPYVDVTSNSPLLLDNIGLVGLPAKMLLAPYVTTMELNGEGRQAVREAIDAAYASCRDSNLLAPPKPCPAQLPASTGIDGTVSWGPADTSDIEIKTFLPTDMTVLVTGTVTIPVTLQSSRGGLEGPVDSYLVTRVDVSQTPPTLI
ncbi:MAG: hypothetical protein K0U84_09195 [Actinomycetia bacterium]|nr:hypothetical protein [Actinomycetes bacterium]